ncbi:hypothetical protein UZ36_02690 [Candidatus Nitromaritima sp. SCGC AAA799-C22]|nr:hypothetical protein UZ36_02690 [Candidatus Nitromaritima sp. SCGC AAA799-C22]
METDFLKFMRIFYFARIDIGEDSAGTRHVFETCRQFAAIGHEVFLFIPDLGARRELAGVSIVPVPVLIRKPEFTYFSFHAFLCIYLLRHCLKNRPDVVYTRHQALEWWATWLKMIFNFRYVIEVNGLALVELKLYKASSWIISVTRFLEWVCFRLPDLWVVPTTQIQDFLCKEYRLDPDRFMVISNGADPEMFCPMDLGSCRSRLGLSGDAKYLLFMGAFRKWHGMLEFIGILPELIRRVPNLKLLLVGDGVIVPEIRKRLVEWGLENHVVFCGQKPLADIPVYINAADICLAPFFDERSPLTGLSPLKLFEYMACGKPVVGSGTGGLDLIFGKFKIGEVIESDDPQSWVPVLEELIGDPERMKVCGENGRRAVLDEFNWKSICKKISDRLSGLHNR